MFESFTEFVVEWIRQQPAWTIYLCFFSIAYLENVIPPIPGDVLVAFAGYLAAVSIINFGTVFSFTTIGSVIGFYHVYYLGRYWGKKIEAGNAQHWLLRHLDIKYLDKVKFWMKKYGQGVVVSNRFLAGTRSVIALVAGMSNLPLKKTLLSSLLSSVLWNLILLGLGWIIHENMQLIGAYLSNYGKIITVLIVLVITTVFVWRKLKH